MSQIGTVAAWERNSCLSELHNVLSFCENIVHPSHCLLQYFYLDREPHAAPALLRLWPMVILAGAY